MSVDYMPYEEIKGGPYLATMSDQLLIQNTYTIDNVKTAFKRKK